MGKPLWLLYLYFLCSKAYREGYKWALDGKKATDRYPNPEQNLTLPSGYNRWVRGYCAGDAERKRTEIIKEVKLSLPAFECLDLQGAYLIMFPDGTMMRVFEDGIIEVLEEDKLVATITVDSIKRNGVMKPC